MNARRRLLYYLLLNVVVSAATTWLVLWGWNRTHPAPTMPALTPLIPTPLPPTATPWPTAEPTRPLTVYIVQPGDSLSSIALQFGVSVEELMTLNALDNPNALGVGQQLFIPLPLDETATPAPTALPERGQVAIVAVLGAGDVTQEEVVIRRLGGSGELSLAGWVLQDTDGNRYVFPQLSVFPDGAVSLFTRPGTDTVVALFWGRTQAVFTPGETITLLDARGQEVARYRIP